MSHWSHFLHSFFQAAQSQEFLLRRSLAQLYHVRHYIYRSLDYLSITLTYSSPFGLLCNSPVQGQIITNWHISA
ncbi:hypothetical protein ACN42_g3125 [Penicillium freii]|uniref:Uncharacterized protein n=1 Tax=Penicillium freii TaxID=48697 RepID=A0A101MNU0_PENFR|nr:hypothetical protein ACN42_g3125 [Penicillium freii]